LAKIEPWQGLDTHLPEICRSLDGEVMYSILATEGWQDWTLCEELELGTAS